MSYSFTLQAPDREAMMVLVDAELSKIAEAQPSHGTDRALIRTNIYNALCVLGSGEDQTGAAMDVHLNCHGYITLHDGKATSIGSTVGVSWVRRPDADDPTV